MKMYAVFFVTLAFVLFQQTVVGQAQKPAYRLKGTINVDTGTVVLLPIGGKEYDPNLNNTYQAKIKQGHFTFEGKMAYPCSFLIAIFPRYVSSPFLIESGDQTIVCNIDSLREIPRISNTITQEMGSVLTKKNAVLFDYAKRHPTSYVVLWDLVRRMSNGYESVLDSTYTALSPSLKNTYTGQMLAKRLKSSKVTAIGQPFPQLSLLNINNQPVLIPVARQSKYTLVDFWFSHCGPCLSEFPKLKELYQSYQKKGFTIVGISIDKKADVGEWKRVISEKELTWSQYLDVDGKLTTHDLSINLFPSNFLLDEQGRIVRKNIFPIQLEKFLAENL